MIKIVLLIILVLLIGFMLGYLCGNQKEDGIMIIDEREPATNWYFKIHTDPNILRNRRSLRLSVKRYD